MDHSPFPCVLDAWESHEAELRHWLLGQVHDTALADDLLQDVFVKALRAGAHFCQLDSPRAWLFQVARHALIDHHRVGKVTIQDVDSLAQPETVALPVDSLTTRLEEALGALDPDDRDVIARCDIEGQTQGAYAAAHELTVPAVKSRIQRARARLRQELIQRAAVRFDTQGRVCCHGPFGQGG